MILTVTGVQTGALVMASGDRQAYSIICSHGQKTGLCEQHPARHAVFVTVCQYTHLWSFSMSVNSIHVQADGLHLTA